MTEKRSDWESRIVSWMVFGGVPCVLLLYDITDACMQKSIHRGFDG